jgi:hypothetical protein
MVRAVYFSLFGSAISAAVRPQLWQPEVGTKWQILISNNIAVDASQALVPEDAPVWDIDMVNTPKGVFDELHSKGKKIICYFSAGSSENWRSDYSQFQSEDMGSDLVGWPGEKWLNTRSESVWAIMASRIKYGADKGCDAIDPDNMGESNS